MEEKKIAGFKGFDKDMKCRGYQYALGRSEKTDDAVTCWTGFHYCENPVDVFRYYPPGKGSKYATVEGSGKIDRHNDDSKISCTELSVGAEISIADMIKLGVTYIWKKATDLERPTSGDYSSAATSGYYSSAATSSYYSSAATSGYSSSAATSGYCSPAVCAGLHSKAKAGKFGCIALAWANEKEGRSEMRCAETGCGDGSDGKLKAHVWYRLNNQGEFMEVPE